MNSLNQRRIVVVGGGMVGWKFADLLGRIDPVAHVCVIGDEPAYDRTQLIHVLGGSRRRDAILDVRTAMPGRVVAIDRPTKVLTVQPAEGKAIPVPYDILVLATGAKPLRPNIPGVERALTLRRLDDVDRIVAASPSSATIIGGGTLGLEMADALIARGCEVTLVHAATQLMERHLDDTAAGLLRESLEAQGVRFLLGSQIAQVEADGVYVFGQRLPSDLVLLATGVQPDDDLARQAGLPCDRGVIVDDDMQTDDPFIFAIGDCVRHDGRAPCLLHHGYEQAHIAAKAIADIDRWAVPTLPPPAIVLKTRCRVFVMGRMEGDATEYRTARVLRKLWLTDGCIVGAIVFGSWDKIPLLRQAVARRDYLPWHGRLALRWAGDPWPLRPVDPRQWPDDAIVCQCNGVSLAAVKASIAAGARSVADVVSDCGAGSGCTGCQPLLARALGEMPPAVADQRALYIAAGAVAGAALLLAVGGIPFSPSFAWRWDFLWRDFIIKQITGYSLLAIGIVLAVTGIVRRAQRLPPEHQCVWRAAHAVAAVAAVVGFLLHCGAHVGQGIAFFLVLSWAGTLLTGAVMALIFARAHLATSALNGLARSAAHGLHIVFLWPLPVLLIYHAAGAYLWS